jgi:lysophospholipase L1-like esterase
LTGLAVVNGGVSGAQIWQLFPPSNSTWTTLGYTKLVFLGGINDINNNASETNATIEGNLKKMWTIGLNDNMKVYALTILPDGGFSGDGHAATISAINSWIKSTAPTMGVVVVDTHALLASNTAPTYLNSTYNSGDGEHPNEAGAEVIAQAVASAITLSPPVVAISPSGTLDMDVGQFQIFTSTVVYGSPPFTYQWFLDGSSVSTNSSYKYTPSASGSHSLFLNVTDSLSERAESNTVSIVVTSGLSVSISPSSGSIDVGQSINFTCSVSGGYGSYSYAWCLNGSRISGASRSSYLFAPSSAGRYNFYLNVTDSLSDRVESNTAAVVVYVAVSVSITPTSVRLNLGQSQTFSSTVSGGSGSYSYQWYVNSSATGTGASYLFTALSHGDYAIYVNVTDSDSFRVKSNVAFVIVNASGFTVTIVPTSANISLAQSVTFNSTVFGGSAPYSYQWYVDGNAVTNATGTTWVFTPATVGTFTVYLIVTDGAAVASESNVVGSTFRNGDAAEPLFLVYALLAVWLLVVASVVFYRKARFKSRCENAR